MTKLAICGKSDIGRQRDRNEDAFLIGGIVENKSEVYLEIPSESSFITNCGLLVAVADGMGGHNAGEVASSLALSQLSAQFMSSARGSVRVEDIKTALRNSILSAHTSLLEAGLKYPTYSGMGTTLVGVCFTMDRFYAYHAGDSRLYRLRHGVLRQLSKDHSLVQSLVDIGKLAAEETYNHPQKHVIINSLGGGSDKCDPEIVDSYKVFDGDIFLICSDGLSDMLDEDVMGSIISTERTLREALILLIDAANGRGGPDNITAVLIKVG
jgi:PPM family protein phosphatase